jgi:Ca-activated chloride channel homolog
MSRLIRAGAVLAAIAAAAAGQQHFRLDSNLVLAPVTVTDARGRYVSDLANEAFTILEDGRLQTIVSVSREATPISLGIVIDTSGSMANKWQAVKTAVASLLDGIEDGDEMFLLTFADSPERQVEFTSDSGAVAAKLGQLTPVGSTALYDAVVNAVSHMRQARPGSRKVLFLVSDGGDNHSRATEREVRRLVEEEDVQVHAIGIHDVMPGMEERRGPWILEDLAEMTGGQHYMIRDAGELPRLARRIGETIHQQYVIAYQPDLPASAGKFRRLTVKVRTAANSSGFHVYARRGYRSL